MTNNENLDRYFDAYAKDFKFNDENHLMLEWYVARVIQKAIEYQSIDLLSLGIGHQTVCRKIIQELESNFAHYLIVEGSKDIIDHFKRSHHLSHKIKVIHSYFENFDTAQKFDLIEMGFILEHVDDPKFVLDHYKKFLKSSGSLLIAVPNARSLHRVIGHKAGMLNDIFQLSPFDLALGHKRYFDINSIERLVIDSGLKIINAEGIYLKPLTTGQMTALHLGPSVMQALLEVGVNYPEICNAMLVEASL